MLNLAPIIYGLMLFVGGAAIGNVLSFRGWKIWQIMSFLTGLGLCVIGAIGVNK